MARKTRRLLNRPFENMNISEKIARNVIAICDREEIKVAYLEKTLGVYTGYFMYRLHYGSCVGADILYNVSEYLGVSMKELCEIEFSVSEGTVSE